MFEPFAEVPLYPLVFPVFWGAALFFTLAMARHLRVFAAARNAGPIPRRTSAARLAGTIRYGLVQTRMFRDLSRGRHALRDLLGLRPAHDRHGERRHGRPHPGDPRDPVRRRPVGRGHGDAERRRGRRARRRRVRDLAARRRPAGAAHADAPRDRHPAAHRRRRRDRAARPGVRGRGARPDRRGDRLEPARRGADGAGSRPARRAVRGQLVGAHRARGGVPVLPAVREAPPHRHGDPEHRAAQARAARAAAGDGPRGRGRDVRHPHGRRPVVEGPARRVHLHRVRPLPAGLSGLEHRQAAQPQDVHHGHPARGRSRRSATSR